MRSVNPLTATEQEVGPLTYLGHRLIVAWYFVFMVTMVLPYLLYGEVRDAFLRAVTHDVVWVQEMNPYIYGGAYPNRSPGDIDPPFPLCTERDNHGLKNYYARLGSVREAEDWLLAHGYKKRMVSHVCAPDTFCSKTMPVRMVTADQESIVNVIVDYGDGDLHFLVFRYPEGKSPLDFSRFETAESPENWFKITWASTDHLPWYAASHMWGGHIQKGYPGESLRE
jgi:hypothetical protein